MAKLTLKSAILLIALIGVVFFSTPTRAADQLSIDNSGCSDWYTGGFNFNNGYGSAYYRQTFTAVDNNISKIVLKKGSQAIYLDTPRHVNLSIVHLNSNQTILATTSIEYDDGVQSTEFTWDLPEPIGLIPEEVYFFAWEQDGACDGAPDFSCFNAIESGNDADGCYAGGEFLAYNIDSEDVRDMYFKIYYDDNFAGGDYVIPDEPSSGKYYTSPVHFKGAYSNSGNYGFDEFWILIGEANSTTTLWSWNMSISTGQNQLYDIPIAMEDGAYWYVPYMLNTATEETSLELQGMDLNDYFTRYSFNVGEDTGASIYDNVLEYCQRTISTSTNPLIKYVVEGFKDAMCVVFIPDRAFVDDLATTSRAFMNQAPIGYIPLVLDAWSDIATTANATSAPPIISSLGGSQYYGIWRQLTEWGIFYYFKMILDLLIIIFIVLYIYKRIRKLIKV